MYGLSTSLWVPSPSAQRWRSSRCRLLVGIMRLDYPIAPFHALLMTLGTLKSAHFKGSRLALSSAVRLLNWYSDCHSLTRGRLLRPLLLCVRTVTSIGPPPTDAGSYSPTNSPPHSSGGIGCAHCGGEPRSLPFMF